MFDLTREVAAWSAAVHAGRCNPDDSVAELSDHLYCEIERGRADGLSDEQAFRAAVAKVGPASQLAVEHAKNRSLLQTGCAAVARHDRGVSGVESRRLLLAHAIVWAALVIASSLLLTKSATPEALGWLAIGVLVPSWWASDLVLRRALRSRPTGGA